MGVARARIRVVEMEERRNCLGDRSDVLGLAGTSVAPWTLLIQNAAADLTRYNKQ